MSETTGFDDYLWLASPDAEPYLVPEVEAQPAHQIVAHLRRELTPTRARLVIEQRRLARRAAERFPGVPHLLWTDRMLQQASARSISRYKAHRFEDHGVLDLCCGGGGDLMQLASRGPALGVDSDPVCVLFASHNTRQHLSSITSENAGGFAAPSGYAALANVEDLRPTRDVAVHIDPDRRPGGRRSTRLDHHRPSKPYLEEIVVRGFGGGIKLAPATDAEDPFLEPLELEWIGEGRSCSQLVAWYGGVARRPNSRVATIVSGDGNDLHWTSATDATRRMVRSERKEFDGTFQAYLVEPHPTLLASSLAFELPASYDMTPITPGCGYLTASNPASSPWWDRFEVIDSVGFREKRVRELLRAHDIGHLEIKTRGVEIDAAALQRRWSQPNGEAGTLFVLRHARRRMAVLTRRCS